MENNVTATLSQLYQEALENGKYPLVLAWGLAAVAIKMNKPTREKLVITIHRFDTEAEAKAFVRGVIAGSKWDNFLILNDEQIVRLSQPPKVD